MSIVSLPLNIHIEIARYLNLHDCLVYSQLSPLCYDVVQYIFAHRDILDFKSVLNNDWQIALSDTELITVLHAHTRATMLTNFCVAPHFTSYSALCNYLSLYWHNDYSADTMYWHNDDSADTVYWHIDDTADTIYTLGHTKGHLYTIQCLAFEGASIRAQSYLLDSIWSKFDTDHEYRVQIDSISSEPYESATCNYTNWSNVSIDSPYRRCTNCLQAFPFSAQCVCDVCFGMDTA